MSLQNKVFVTKTTEGFEFAYKNLTIGDLNKPSEIASNIAFPRNFYLLALQAFKTCVKGYGPNSDTMPAGDVLSVGINILETSGFFSTPDKIQKDLEIYRKHVRTYFESIRSYACLHFGYRLEDTINWTYQDLLEVAARLEFTLGIDLTFKEPEAEQKKVSRANMGGSGTEFSIRKGDQVSSRVMAAHDNLHREGVNPLED